VTALAVLPDESALISGSADGLCKVWQPSSGQLLHSFDKHRGAITTVRVIFAPDTNIAHLDSDPSTATAIVPTALRKFPDDKNALLTIPAFMLSAPVHRDRKRPAAGVPVRTASESDADRLERIRLQQHGQQRVAVAEVAASEDALPTSAATEQELLKLREQCERWQRVNNQLYRWALSNIQQQQQQQEEEQPNK